MLDFLSISVSLGFALPQLRRIQDNCTRLLARVRFKLVRQPCTDELTGRRTAGLLRFFGRQQAGPAVPVVSPRHCHPPSLCAPSVPDLSRLVARIIHCSVLYRSRRCRPARSEPTGRWLRRWPVQRRLIRHGGGRRIGVRVEESRGSCRLYGGGLALLRGVSKRERRRSPAAVQRLALRTRTPEYPVGSESQPSGSHSTGGPSIARSVPN